MNLLRAFRAFGIAFALVLIGVVGHASVSPVWQSQTPSIQGAWLGDGSFNIFTIWRAHITLSGISYTPSIAAPQTAGQANCTQLNADGMFQVTTSASTGYLCLPTAVAGKEVLIANGTTQTIDLYTSATPYVSGTQDTINGTTGTTAYTNLTTGKNADCFAPNNGAWYCTSGN